MTDLQEKVARIREELRHAENVMSQMNHPKFSDDAFAQVAWRVKDLSDELLCLIAEGQEPVAWLVEWKDKVRFVFDLSKHEPNREAYRNPKAFRFFPLYLHPEPTVCKRCNGTGIVTVAHTPGEGFDAVDWDEECPECSQPKPTDPMRRDHEAMERLRTEHGSLRCHMGRYWIRTCNGNKSHATDPTDAILGRRDDENA